MQKVKYIHPTKHRYHLALIYKDLFENWTLTTVHGGLRNRLGNTRSLSIPSERAGQEVLNKLIRHWAKRGYVPPPQNPAHAVSAKPADLP